MTPQGSKHVVILTYIITVVLTEISMVFIINLNVVRIMRMDVGSQFGLVRHYASVRAPISL